MSLLNAALPVKAHFEEAASESDESVALGQEMTAEIPGSGGRLFLSAAGDLDPTGAILVEPNTNNEELVRYESIEGEGLVGITRDDPSPHGIGEPVVQAPLTTPPTTSYPTTSPVGPSGSSSPTPAPTETVTLPASTSPPPGIAPIDDSDEVGDGGSSPSLALDQEMTFLIPGDGGRLLLTSVDGLTRSRGAILVDPGSAWEELVYYQSLDPEVPALVGIQRPVPRSHSIGTPVSPASSSLDAPCDGNPVERLCEEVVALLDEYCPALPCADIDGPIADLIAAAVSTACPTGLLACPEYYEAAILAIVDTYCPELQCAQSTIAPLENLITEVSNSLEDIVCGPDAGFKEGGCDDYLIGIVTDLINEICPDLNCADEVQTTVLQLLHEILDEHCGGHQASDCVAYVESMVNEVCPELSCPDDALIRVSELLEDAVQTLCNGPTASCVDVVLQMVLGVIEQVCPGLQCADSTLFLLLDIVQGILIGLCNGETEACSQNLQTVLQGLIDFYCPNSDCPAAIIDRIEEFFNDPDLNTVLCGAPCIDVRPADPCDNVCLGDVEDARDGDPGDHTVYDPTVHGHNGYKVYISPGHVSSSQNPFPCGPSTEWEEAWKAAWDVKDRLTFLGYKVMMPEKAKDVGLVRRVDRAHAWKDRNEKFAYVPIHSNAGHNPVRCSHDHSGTLLLYQQSSDERLGTKIFSRIADASPGKPREHETRVGNFCAIRFIWELCSGRALDMPTGYIEVEFHDTGQGAEFIRNNNTPNGIRIGNGINCFLADIGDGCE